MKAPSVAVTGPVGVPGFTRTEPWAARVFACAVTLICEGCRTIGARKRKVMLVWPAGMLTVVGRVRPELFEDRVMMRGEVVAGPL